MKHLALDRSLELVAAAINSQVTHLVALTKAAKGG
jgi:hypothetical protein